MSQHSAWASAQDCRDASGKRNPTAKRVLGELAKYADPDGYVWALVPVLAIEVEVSERTVQRGIRDLIGLALLEETRRRHVRAGKIIPVYRLPIERGPANTRERLAIEEGAARDQSGVTPMSPQKICGDADVTPSGDIHDRSGVTPMSPKEKGKVEDNPKAGAREGELEAWEDWWGRVMTAWAQAAADRVAPVPDRALWIALMEAGERPDVLGPAALRYLAESPDVKRGRCVALGKWLAERRWLAWPPRTDVAGQALAAGRASWSGPPEIRADLVAARGEAFARSYLDPASWDPSEPGIWVRTRLAHERLVEGLKAAGHGALPIGLMEASR